MKKLGLVGGMGPESTIPYYHDIVYGVQEALGQSVFPELSIESVNVFDVLRLCGEQKIVLGCTELPMLLNDDVSPVSCLDTMQIHINAIINTILDRDLEDVVPFSNIIEENICKF